METQFKPGGLNRDEWRQTFLDSAEHWRDRAHPSHVKRQALRTSAITALERHGHRHGMSELITNCAVANALSDMDIGKGGLYDMLVDTHTHEEECHEDFS